MDQNNTITLRTVVNKARMTGRIPEQDDAMCFQLAIDGMKDLSLFSLPQKQMVKITVDSLGRVQLPKDYLMFIAIGVPRNGVLYTFTNNKSIVQTTDKTYVYEAKDTTYGEGQSIPVVAQYSYGSGGGINETYFVINERGRYIQLLDFTGTEATLHYVSSGISDSPDGVEIPVIAEDALIAYVLWKYVQYDNTVPISEKEYRKLAYADAEADIDKIYMPTASEILDVYYSTLMQTIKR